MTGYLETKHKQVSKILFCINKESIVHKIIKCIKQKCTLPEKVPFKTYIPNVIFKLKKTK